MPPDRDRHPPHTHPHPHPSTSNHSQNQRMMVIPTTSVSSSANSPSTNDDVGGGINSGNPPQSEGMPSVGSAPAASTFPTPAQMGGTTSRIEVMERVLFHVHTRTCNLGLAYTSDQTRRLLEHFLLVVAICCFGALILLHRSFVVPRGVAGVFSGPAGTGGGGVFEGYPPELARTCLHGLPNFDPNGADITHLVILPHPGATSQQSANPSQPQQSRVVWKRPSNVLFDVPPNARCNVSASSAEDMTCEIGGNNELPKDHDPWLDEQLRLAFQQQDDGDDVESSLQVYYSYSTTKAYLMLPQEHPILDRLHVQYVLISPTDPQCFGEPFLQFLIWKCFVGPDIILLNWLLTFDDGYDPEYPHHNDDSSLYGDTARRKRRRKQGYAYNPRTQRLQELGPDSRNRSTRRGIMNNLRDDDVNIGDNDDIWGQWWRRWRYPTLLSKLGVLLQTSFLFFFCTTLVSFTLRETQERMLDFTRELSRRVQQSLPVSDLITTHLVQNLVFVPIMVGMMFFLIEFYGGDKYLAFSVSSIVWCAEVFSIVSLRSSQGLQYFPKFFFLLFLLFHVYQLAFRDTGFVYVALTVVWCFILHSMVFFWHRYELPAVALGYVTVDRPRMVSTNTSHVANATNDRRSDRALQEGREGDPTSDTVLGLEASPSSRIRTVRHSSDSANDVTTATTDRPLPGRRDSATNRANSNNTNSNTANALMPVPSHHSFSTSSSRNVSGLFRNNHDDDSSTGSLLYFMGGEVVLHRSESTNSRSGGNGAVASVMGGGSGGGILGGIARNESNLSLQSSSWEVTGENNTTALDSHGRVGRWDGNDEDKRGGGAQDQDDFAPVPHAQSMETVHSSNQSPNKSYPIHGTDYDQESGGLRAILESRLTPRHSNAQQPSDRRRRIVGGDDDPMQLNHSHSQSRPQQYHSTAPTGMLLEVGNSAHTVAPASLPPPYQRTPPTFPDLPSGNGRR